MGRLSKIAVAATIILLALLAYAFHGHYKSAVKAGQAAQEQLKKDLEEAVKYDRIPLRKKIGRMFIVSLDSCGIKRDDPVFNKIKDLGVGGVIYFGYNIPASDQDSTSRQKLTTICSRIQAAADYNVLIGIDQEGGKVMRLRSSKGYTELPSHAYLGRIDNEDSTRHYASITAEMLKDIGINLNYAPCVDVNMNPECPVIGKAGRSFSSDPSEVGEHAGHYISEHRKHGVLTAVKHFPGHGSSVTDSHNGLTDISLTWKREELEPFSELIANDCCDMVMVGHIFNRQIDSLYPASLSKATVQELLRNELGWRGLVVSDDLGMKAINDNYPLEESLRLCVNAGVDMLMLIANGTPERLETAISLIEKMVLDGRIPKSRINEAYVRINRAIQ